MKNCYCRRTKLTTNEFELVASQFVTGATASETAQWLAESKNPISRQSIEKKFLDLGNYLYRKYPYVDYEKFAAALNQSHQLARVKKLFLDAIWNEIRGTQDYAGFRKANVPYVVNEKLAYVLKWRWRLFNGFTRKNLTAHLGFASFFLETAHMNRMQAWRTLLEHLEKDPL